MKITFLLHDAYAVQGATATVAPLAAALAERHEVEIVSYYRTTQRPLLPMPGVTLRPLVDLPASAPGTFREAPASPNALGDAGLARYLRATDTDVVIATSPYTARFLAEHSRPGHPGYLRISREDSTRDLKARETLRAYESAIRRLDGLVTVTDADTHAYRRALADATTKITHIPPCIPAPLVEQGGGDSRIVMAAGRLGLAERHDRLVDAFSNVVTVHPDWTLRLYGEGLERSALRRRIDTLGLYDHVLLMGARTPVDPEWAKAAIAVVPGSTEPSGTGIVAPLRFGVPLIGTDRAPAAREIITHGENGLLVPWDGAVEDALAGALCRLIENDTERRSMAEAARRGAERFLPEHIAAHYEAFITGMRPELTERSGSRRRPTDTRVRHRMHRLGQQLRLADLFGNPVAPVTVSARATADGSLTFRARADQLPPGAWHLALLPRNGTIGSPPVRLALAASGECLPRTADAVLHKDKWLPTEGDWGVFVQHARGGRRRPVRAGLVETAALLAPPALPPSDNGCGPWIPYVTPDGTLAVRTWNRPDHAELESVVVTDTGIVLTGTIYGSTARSHHYRFHARMSEHPRRMFDVPCHVDPHGGFTVTLPFAPAAGLHPGGEAVWELILSAYGGSELRPARLLGDIADRRDVNVFPAVPCSGPQGRVTFRPCLTDRHELVLRASDGRDH
ncbi:glycosyltransferase [Streptomyces acidicola]|uniref:glycosyltransferase n=1 Tax=Streptomyces acidicola TaxID=2596892 RepID=UPI00381B7B9D